MRAWLDRNWKWLGILLAVVGWAVAAIQAVQRGDPIPPPPVLVDNRHEAPELDPPAAGAAPFNTTGWVNDPDEVAAVSATLPVKVFGDTPAGAIQEIPAAVYGWKAFEKLGLKAPIKNQGNVGSCVGHGTNTAAEYTLADEIARRRGSAGEWARFAEEATYGFSRVDIGGGRIRGDGSVGAWAAKAETQLGNVPRKPYPSRDLTTYSESLCREWGGRGVPAEFHAVAAQYRVKSFVQVKVWEEAKAALAQGYYVAVCSNQGFSMRRDENGICRPSGSWAHCMALTGYHTENRREYGHITNSWGPTAHTGPVGWGDPPTDGFWADASVIDRMLRQGDSWAFSGVIGFPRRAPLDWLIHAPRRPLDLVAVRHHTRPEALLAW